MKLFGMSAAGAAAFGALPNLSINPAKAVEIGPYKPVTEDEIFDRPGDLLGEYSKVINNLCNTSDGTASLIPSYLKNKYNEKYGGDTEEAKANREKIIKIYEIVGRDSNNPKGIYGEAKRTLTITDDKGNPIPSVYNSILGELPGGFEEYWEPLVLMFDAINGKRDKYDECGNAANLDIDLFVSGFDKLINRFEPMLTSATEEEARGKYRARTLAELERNKLREQLAGLEGPGAEMIRKFMFMCPEAFVRVKKLIPGDQNYVHYKEDFPDLDGLVITFDSNDESGLAAAEIMGALTYHFYPDMGSLPKNDYSFYYPPDLLEYTKSRLELMKGWEDLYKDGNTSQIVQALLHDPLLYHRLGGSRWPKGTVEDNEAYKDHCTDLNRSIDELLRQAKAKLKPGQKLGVEELFDRTGSLLMKEFWFNEKYQYLDDVSAPDLLAYLTKRKEIFADEVNKDWQNRSFVVKDFKNVPVALDKLGELIAEINTLGKDRLVEFGIDIDYVNDTLLQILSFCELSVAAGWLKGRQYGLRPDSVGFFNLVYMAQENILFQNADIPGELTQHGLPVTEDFELTMPLSKQNDLALEQARGRRKKIDAGLVRIAGRRLYSDEKGNPSKEVAYAELFTKLGYSGAFNMIRVMGAKPGEEEKTIRMLAPDLKFI